jgi:hypothetical protein
MLRWIGAIVLVLAAAAAMFWFRARGGWFGADQGPGTIEGKAEIIAARMSARRAAGEDEDQVLFGDRRLSLGCERLHRPCRTARLILADLRRLQAVKA